VAREHPDGVDQSRDIAEQGQQDIDPEVRAESDFEEDAQRWNDDGEDDAKQVCHGHAMELD